MKKIVFLTLLTMFSLSFGLVVQAVEEIAYTFTVSDNYWYDLETGEYEINLAYATTNRFAVNSLDLDVDAVTFHHLLMFDKNNNFIGYYNTIYSTLQTTKYLGDIGAGTINLHASTSKIAFQIYKSTNDLAVPELNGHTLAEVFEDGNMTPLNPKDWTSIIWSYVDNGDDTITYLRTSTASNPLMNVSLTIGNQYYNSFYAKRHTALNTEYHRITYSSYSTFITETLTRYSFKTNVTNIPATITMRSNIYTVDYDVTFGKHYLIDMTSLGIDTLTVEEMDAYYDLYIDNLNLDDYVTLLTTTSFTLILPSYEREELAPSELDDLTAETFLEKMLTDAGFNSGLGETVIAVIILLAIAIIMAIRRVPNLIILSVVMIAYVGLSLLGWVPVWINIVFGIILVLILFIKFSNKGGGNDEE